MKKVILSASLCAVITPLILISPVAADSRFALVDSVHIDQDLNTTLISLGTQTGNQDERISLSGMVWSSSESSDQAQRQITIEMGNDVVKQAEKQVADDGVSIFVNDVQYTRSEHTYTVGDQHFNRIQYVSSDRDAIVFVNDDPDPLAIPAFIAGATVALCTVSIVNSMYACEGASNTSISFSSPATLSATEETHGAVQIVSIQPDKLSFVRLI